jgi:S-formylglutathione hydrolase
MSAQVIKSWKSFGGMQYVYRHASSSTSTDMEVAVFVPTHAEGETLPALFYLSGLTCTWENATTKSGAQRYAAEHGIILVMPDTSPRGPDVPDEEVYTLGQGAGYYIDATQAPWSRNYRMWSYVTEELPKVIAEVAPFDTTRKSIMGHSMGGHGALVAALRNPKEYRAVSAIAPIAALCHSPSGKKALATYIGDNRADWLQYDASALVATTQWDKPILLDQGSEDEFLETLHPELFVQACKDAGVALQYRLQEGYDHSYYFIATVIGDHIAWHARALKG